MFRWGIIGTGYVSRKFILGLKYCPDAAVTLVHSRTASSAETFASDFAIAKVARTLEEAVASAEVDAFYIATPPSLHAPQAIACLTAGKPVLLEKPFANSREEAQAIADAARAAGVFCMEGMWTRFMPVMEDLRAALRFGAIGEPCSFAASFGMATTVDTADNLFNPALGGGALLHRGIYPISMAFDLLGPASLVGAAGRIGETGVDEDCSLVLRHESGALSTLRASLRAPLANDASVEGTGGAIRLDAPIFRPRRFAVSKVAAAPRSRRGNLRVEALRESAPVQALQQRAASLVSLARRGRKAGVVKSYGGNGYHYEAEEAMRCIREGRTESALMPLAESIAIAAVMEEARKAWSDAR